jgi:hypothetical protein
MADQAVTASGCVSESLNLADPVLRPAIQVFRGTTNLATLAVDGLNGPAWPYHGLRPAAVAVAGAIEICEPLDMFTSRLIIVTIIGLLLGGGTSDRL